MTEKSFRTISRRSAIRGASFVFVIPFVSALICGCSHNKSDSDTGSNSTSDASADFDSSNMKSSDVVATVNNDPITVGELFDGMEHYVPAQLPGFPNNLQLNQPSGRIVLQNLVVDKIKIQIAKTQNVPVADSDLDKSFQDYKLLQDAQSTLPYDTLLQQQGYTQDQFKHEVLAPQVAEINILQKLVVISPEALQESYKSSVATYTVPAAVHFHRIVLATLSQAQSVAASLKSGKPIATFDIDNLAKDGQGGNISDDTDFAKWIRTENPDPALGPAGPALATAKIGDVVGPFQISHAWWVMKVVDKRASQLLPFDQVQDLVRINYVRQVAGQSGNAALQVGILQNMHNSLVRINIPAYANLAAQMHDISIPNPGPSTPSSPSVQSPTQKKQ